MERSRFGKDGLFGSKVLYADQDVCWRGVRRPGWSDSMCAVQDDLSFVGGTEDLLEEALGKCEQVSSVLCGLYSTDPDVVPAGPVFQIFQVCLDVYMLILLSNDLLLKHI